MNIMCFHFWRLFCSFLLSLLLLFQFSSPAYAVDSCELHGMRVVGQKAIYLSHMGLFNDPCHKTQAIFEVSLSAAPGAQDPQKIYFDAQAKNLDQNEFTIEPVEGFKLKELNTGGGRTSFKALLHEGQYERTGRRDKPLAKNVTVTVKRVVSFRPLMPTSPSKHPPTLEYLLFGSSDEPLAAHLITSPPDFDQIVAIKTPLTKLDGAAKDIDLTQGAMRLVFPNRKTNRPTDTFTLALKPDLTTGTPKPAVQIDSSTSSQALETVSQYFFETRDFK